MFILSFDVSSVSSGWALLVGGKLQEFGIIKISSGYQLQEKLYLFKNNVNALLKIFKPDYVVVEETYLKNVKTLKTLMQFISVVNIETFEVLGNKPIFLSPNTVRSYFELKTKEDVFNYIKNKYKVKFKNIEFEEGNDMSDATLQALYWYNVLIKKEKK